MPKKVKGVHRSNVGTRKDVVKRFCKRCQQETYFSRRVRPNGHLQHDCKSCKQRRDKKRHTPTYNSWRNMWDRCTNPNAWNWKYYGGRGVLICARWGSFEAFLEDMKERPEGLTLDRVDVNGEYEKSNCRWATWTEQQTNKRRPEASADTFAYYLEHNENESRAKGLADGKDERAATG